MPRSPLAGGGFGDSDLRRPAARQVARAGGALRAVAAELVEPVVEIDAVAAKPALGENGRDLCRRLAGAKRSESTIMRASRGGSASARSRLPSVVMRPSASSAPSSCSRLFASFSAGAGGGSRNDSVAGSVTPHCARSSTSEDRSADRISGWV